MLRKTYFVAIILVFAIGCVFGQQDTVRFTKLKLENGASIKGYMLKDINPENLILKTPSGNSFFIDMEDIRKIKFGRYGIINRSNSDVTPMPITRVYDQRIGTYSLFGVGLNFSEYNSHVSLTTEFGKRFNERFALGLGINYDRDQIVSSLPIYLNGRAYLNNRKVSPFAYAGMGYGFAWANDNLWNFEVHEVNGGFMGQLGIGYQLNFSGSAMLFNLGYKLQRVYQDYDYSYYTPWSSFVPTQGDPYYNVKVSRLLRRAEFKVSFLF